MKFINFIHRIEHIMSAFTDQAEDIIKNHLTNNGIDKPGIAAEVAKDIAPLVAPLIQQIGDLQTSDQAKTQQITDIQQVILDALAKLTAGDTDGATTILQGATGTDTTTGGTDTGTGGTDTTTGGAPDTNTGGAPVDSTTGGNSDPSEDTTNGGNDSTVSGSNN